MKMIKKIIALLLVLSLLTGGIAFYMYSSSLKAVDANDNELMEFTIEEGTYLNEILDNLEASELINSAFMAKIYTKLNPVNSFKFGIYNLSKSMSLAEILSEFEKGSNYNPDQITVTFIEQLNLNEYKEIIDANFSISGDAFIEEISTVEFLTPLIEEYWFLTEDILSDGIYFPLEGYLTPNTYAFTSKDATSLEIVKTMLDQLDSILTEFKDSYKNHEITSIHELLTLASIVEEEATTDEDRIGVAGVFMNRLEDNTLLGSDVTTYYGIGVLMGDRDLYQSDIDAVNGYNTRSAVVGLPVGPIANPSRSSINAVINYRDFDGYYFVSDKNLKIYFAETYREHLEIISYLKENGLWYVYE